MKSLILAAVASVMFGCSTDIASVGETTKKITNNTRLSMTNNNPNVVSMKRLIIDAPSNVIISNVVKNDSVYGDFEEVTIDWGKLKKENYDFTYYLFSTDNAVRIDSIVFDDTLTQNTKVMTNALITKSIGMTGDGILPIKMINDTLQGNTRFWGKNVDTNFVMTIFGKDTLTKQLTKLKVNFHFVQDVKSFKCVDFNCVNYDTTNKPLSFIVTMENNKGIYLDSDTINVTDSINLINYIDTTNKDIIRCKIKTELDSSYYIDMKQELNKAVVYYNRIYDDFIINFANLIFTNN